MAEFNASYLEHGDATDTLRDAAEKNYCRRERLACVEIEQGIILPQRKSPDRVWGLGGVLREDGSFVEESLQGVNGDIVFGGGYGFAKSALTTSKEEVVYLGPITRHWGNFLVDNISRLWFVLGEPEKWKIAYCGVSVAPNTLGPASRQCYELLNLLGISRCQLVDIRQPTRFSRVYVPELSFFRGAYYTSEYRSIYEKACRNFAAKGVEAQKKIYFTRTRLRKRKEVGESQIARFFSKNGFEIHAPEMLSVSQQIFLVCHCSLMVSIEGTAAHLVLFGSEGMEQVVLRKQSWVNSRQLMLAQLTGIRTTFVDVYREPFKGFPVSHDLGPFLVEMSRGLRRFAIDSDMEVQTRCSDWNRLYQLLIYGLKCIQLKLKRAIVKKWQRLSAFRRVVEA